MQLDGIDAVVAHPSRCCYAYKQVHPHIKGDGGCSFVFPKSGLPEQLLCARYRSGLDIVRDLDRRSIGNFFRLDRDRKSFVKSFFIVVMLRLCVRKSC